MDHSSKYYSENQVRMRDIWDSYKNSISLYIFITLPCAALIFKLIYRKFIFRMHLIHSIHIYSIAIFYLILNELYYNSTAQNSYLILFLMTITFSMMRVYQEKFLRTFFKAIYFIFVAGIIILIFLAISFAASVYLLI
jgi:hypothetical protein